jgi:hypothetical protein
MDRDQLVKMLDAARQRIHETRRVVTSGVQASITPYYIHIGLRHHPDYHATQEQIKALFPPSVDVRFAFH